MAEKDQLISRAIIIVDAAKRTANGNLKEEYDLLNGVWLSRMAFARYSTGEEYKEVCGIISQAFNINIITERLAQLRESLQQQAATQVGL